MSGVIFVADAQGIPLDFPTLVSEGAFVPRSQGILAIRRMVLGRLKLQGIAQTEN